jgi:hypothetical protein
MAPSGWQRRCTRVRNRVALQAESGSRIARRTDMSRKKAHRSSFAYLSRSGSTKRRALMQNWLAGVPASEHGVCARFRSEESELTCALQENDQELSTSAG